MKIRLLALAGLAISFALPTFAHKQARQIHNYARRLKLWVKEKTKHTTTTMPQLSLRPTQRTRCL